MATDDFFCVRPDQVIDVCYPLAELAGRIPESLLEKALATRFAQRYCDGRAIEDRGLFGPTPERVDACGAPAGAPHVDPAGGLTPVLQPRVQL